LPEFKNFSAERGQRYSGVWDYSQKVKIALKEMARQVEGLKTNERGIAFRVAHKTLGNAGKLRLFFLKEFYTSRSNT
jgi:uncharacterized Fe-S radical SAM superfamily protein PflX